jgi:hypothetical protein
MIFDNWDLVEADLHSVYGVDLGDRSAPAGRTWRWLKLRIVGLVSVESRLATALSPPDRHAGGTSTPSSGRATPRTAYDDPVD